MAVLNSDALTKGAKPVKSLLATKKTAGRNALGTYYQDENGGGVKQKYRIIDFKRQKQIFLQLLNLLNMIQIERVISLLFVMQTVKKLYILAPHGLNVGDTIISSESADIKVGNSKLLKDIPVGTLIHNVELHPRSGGQLARSAGSYAQLMGKEGKEALLRLPSGEMRVLRSIVVATIGQVGNFRARANRYW